MGYKMLISRKLELVFLNLSCYTIMHYKLTSVKA